MDLEEAVFNTILVVIGAITTIPVARYLDKKKKRLVFEELQNLSIIDVKKEFRDKIEIKYEGRLVDNLFVSTAMLKNKGSVPIKKSDAERPIEIIFDKEFLDCEVIDENPEGLDVNLAAHFLERSIKLEVNLLNPGDYIIFQFISLEKLNTPKVISRIEGLSKIDIVANAYQTYTRSKEKSFYKILEHFITFLIYGCSIAGLLVFIIIFKL